MLWWGIFSCLAQNKKDVVTLFSYKGCSWSKKNNKKLRKKREEIIDKVQSPAVAALFVPRLCTYDCLTPHAFLYQATHESTVNYFKFSISLSLFFFEFWFYTFVLVSSAGENHMCCCSTHYCLVFALLLLGTSYGVT